MGSVAMDQAGDLALGYSVSSSSVSPSIRFAGRVPTDPASTLESEVSIVSGTGSQTGNSLSRWGDYSAMQVDPVDDCTFWFTEEYMKTTGTFNWNTRIANFKFPGCGTTATPDFTIGASPIVADRHARWQRNQHHHDHESERLQLSDDAERLRIAERRHRGVLDESGDAAGERQRERRR